jgi:hypothetical protein
MTLAEEAQRYLEVVDFFRAEGCEPHWRPEAAPMLVKRPADARDDRPWTRNQRRKTV